MSNPSSTVGNGCSLEDCYTNVFSISDFRDIQFCKYTYTQANNTSLSSSAADCPLLKTYTKCLNADLLCTWNRVRPSSSGDTGPDFSQPYKFTQFDLELWVWWHGDVQPPVLHSLIAPGVKESKHGGWTGGLEYDCRTAYFKALYERLERSFLSKGYLRMNHWYVPCSRTLNSYTTENLEYSMGFHFFLHGESTVCVTIDIRQLRRLRHLLPSDLHALRRKGPNARLPVKLAPYAHNALLCATTHPHPQSREQEEVRLTELYRCWREFYKFPLQNSVSATTTNADDSDLGAGDLHHEDNDVSKLPNMVEVIVATHRMFYPSFLVMLAVESSDPTTPSGEAAPSTTTTKPDSTASSLPTAMHPTDEKVGGGNHLKRKRPRKGQRVTSSMLALGGNGARKHSTSLLSLLSLRSHQRTLQDIVVMMGANFCKDLFLNSTVGDHPFQNMFHQHVHKIPSLLLEPNTVLPCRCRRHNRRGDKRRRLTMGNGNHQSLRQHFSGSLISENASDPSQEAVSTEHQVAHPVETAATLAPSKAAIGHPLHDSLTATSNDMERLCSRRRSPPPVRPAFPCDQPDLTMPTLSPQQAEPGSGSCGRGGGGVAPLSKLCSSLEENEGGGVGVVAMEEMMERDVPPEMGGGSNKCNLKDDNSIPIVIPFSSAVESGLGYSCPPSVNSNFALERSLSRPAPTSQQQLQQQAAATASSSSTTSLVPATSNATSKSNIYLMSKFLPCWLYREYAQHMQMTQPHLTQSRPPHPAHTLPHLEVDPLEYEYWCDTSFSSEPCAPLPPLPSKSVAKPTFSSSSSSSTNPIHWTSMSSNPPMKIPKLEKTVTVSVDTLAEDKTRTGLRSDGSVGEEDGAGHSFQSPSLSSFRGSLFKPSVPAALSRYPYQCHPYQHHRGPLIPLVNGGVVPKLGTNSSTPSGYEPSACMLPTPPSNEMLNQPMLSPATSAVLFSAGSLGFEGVPSQGSGTLLSLESGGLPSLVEHGYMDPGVVADTEHILTQCFELAPQVNTDTTGCSSSNWRFLRSTQMMPAVGANYRALSPMWKEEFSHPELLPAERAISLHSESMNATSTLSSYYNLNAHLHSHGFASTSTQSAAPLASGHHNHSSSLACMATNLPQSTTSSSSTSNTPSKSLLRAANSHQAALPSGAPLGCYAFSSNSAAATPLGTPYPPSQPAAQFSPWHQNSVGNYSTHSNMQHGNTSHMYQQQCTPGPSSIHSLPGGGLHTQPFSAGTADSCGNTVPHTGGDRFSNHASVNWPVVPGTVHSVGMLGTSSVPSVSQQRYVTLREADSLWFITILSDSLFNVVKDHNFDTSCNICECSRTALGSEVGLYVAYHSPVKNKQTQQLLTSAAACKCAFSALANRRRAGVSNLFYEDEVDIIGDRSERVLPTKISIWGELLSCEERMATSHHSPHYVALPSGQLMHSIFGEGGPFSRVIDEFALRTMLRLHRLEQSVALHLTRSLHRASATCDVAASTFSAYISEGVPVNTLEYNDGTLWSLLALEQSTLTADGTIQPYTGGAAIDLRCEPIPGDVERRSLTTWNILSRHFHPLTPADIPDSYNDQIRLLKTIRPWLQEALSPTRRMEYVYTVEGPLTWAAFHKLAGRGLLETCEPQPVAQFQMAVAQHAYSLLGGPAEQQMLLGDLSSSSLPTSVPTSASMSAGSSASGPGGGGLPVVNTSSSTNTGLPAISSSHHKSISSHSIGRSPLNELLQCWSSDQSSGSASSTAHSRACGVWGDTGDVHPSNKMLLSPMPPRKENFFSLADMVEDHAGVVISPYAIPLWQSLNLAPYSKAKDVAYLLIAPNEKKILRSSANYLRQLKHVYEHCHLGRFRPLPSSSEFVEAKQRKPPGSSKSPVDLQQGILSIPCPFEDDGAGGGTSGMSKFGSFYLQQILCNADFNNPHVEHSEEWSVLVANIKQLLATYCDSVCEQMKLLVAQHDGMESLTLQQAFQRMRLTFTSMVNGYCRLSAHAKRLMSLFPYSDASPGEESVVNNVYCYNQSEAEVYITVYLVNPFSLAMDEVATEFHRQQQQPPSSQQHQSANTPHHSPSTVSSATKYSPLARLVTQSLLTCVHRCRQIMPMYWQERCNFQLISINDLLTTSTPLNVENDAMSPERLFTMALATYEGVDRLLVPSLRANSKRALSRIAPVTEKERLLQEKRQRRANREPLRFYAPPYILASGVYHSGISGLSGASKPVAENPLHLGEPNATPKFYLQSHATQREGVLLVTYCLSSDLHWLLAVCTDEVGSLLHQTTINIWVPEKHRRRKASARKHGLNKLWEWVLSIIASLPQAWRLIVGRLGRIGHGELLSLEGLTSRKNLQRCNQRLRHSCSNANGNDFIPPGGMMLSHGAEESDGCSHCPRLLSACVTSLELHPSLRIYTGAVQQEERASSSLPITTPRDASVTHILVFPTSSCITAQQDSDLNMGASSFDGPNLAEILNIFDSDLMGQNEDLTAFFESDFFVNIPSLSDVFGMPDTQHTSHDPPGGRMGESSNAHPSISDMNFPGGDPSGSHFYSSNDNGGMFDGASASAGRSGMDGGSAGFSQQTAAVGDQGTSNSATKNEADPQSGENNLMQQPLAMGYYVSTAPTGPLPSWLWCSHTTEDPYQHEDPSSSNAATRHHTDCFLAALQLQSTLVTGHTDSTGSTTHTTHHHNDTTTTQQTTTTTGGGQPMMMNTTQPCTPPHPLDSSTTCDVLRYVLETYNALSWLTLDPVLRERRTCLPVHMLVLLQLYHSHNAFL